MLTINSQRYTQLDTITVNSIPITTQSHYTIYVVEPDGIPLSAEPKTVERQQGWMEVGITLVVLCLWAVCAVTGGKYTRTILIFNLIADLVADRRNHLNL